MKLSARKEALLPALTRVSGATDRKAAHPGVPSGLIGLKMDDGHLRVDASDGELSWTVDVADVAADDGFACSVDGKLLLDVLRQAPTEADIRAGLENGTLEVRYGRSRFSMSAFPFDERMIWTERADANAVVLELEAADLRRWLDATSFAMAVKDVRYFLEGLLLLIRDRELHCVATDGHRLAHICSPLDGANANLGPVQSIMPRRAITELRRNLASFEGSITLQISDRTASIVIDRDRLDFRLIEGQFPDYERVIPGAAERPVSINAQQLARAVQRVSLVSNERAHSVRLVFEGNEVIVRSFSDRNEAEERVDAQHDLAPMEVGFNPQYLNDVLALVGDETVNLSIRDASSSVRIDAPSLPGAEYVVMPIRL